MADTIINDGVLEGLWEGTSEIELVMLKYTNPTKGYSVDRDSYESGAEAAKKLAEDYIMGEVDYTNVSDLIRDTRWIVELRDGLYTWGDEDHLALIERLIKARFQEYIKLLTPKAIKKYWLEKVQAEGGNPHTHEIVAESMYKVYGLPKELLKALDGMEG